MNSCKAKINVDFNTNKDMLK